MTGTDRTRSGGWLDALLVDVDVVGSGADTPGAGAGGCPTCGTFFGGSKFKFIMAQCKQRPGPPPRTSSRPDLLRYRLRVRDRQGWQ